MRALLLGISCVSLLACFAAPGEGGTGGGTAGSGGTGGTGGAGGVGGTGGVGGAGGTGGVGGSGGTGGAGGSGGTGGGIAGCTSAQGNWFTPGCGTNPIAAAGCFKSCSSDAMCGTNEICQYRSVDPCGSYRPSSVDAGSAGSPAPPQPQDGGSGDFCGACGSEQKLCVPRPPTTCTTRSPGCGANPLPNAACYNSCALDSDCTGGLVCETRSYNPCANSTCQACGADAKFCVVATGTPLPEKCEVMHPGCSTNAIAEGCYVRCTSDAQCGGKKCTDKVNDPCFGKGCDACSEPVKVCL